MSDNRQMVLFLVDDSLFVRDLFLQECTETLEANQDALGYSLRLGRNTVNCYPRNASQDLLEFREVSPATLKYNWMGAGKDFGYSLEISCSFSQSQMNWKEPCACACLTAENNGSSATPGGDWLTVSMRQ